MRLTNGASAASSATPNLNPFQSQATHDCADVQLPGLTCGHCAGSAELCEGHPKVGQADLHSVPGSIQPGHPSEKLFTASFKC
jgi:hypothetical protein